MRTLFYQCAAGISGDMNLGALVDLGVDQAYLIAELQRLRLDGEFTLSFTRAEKSGIWGTRAHVHVHHRHGDGPYHHHHHHHADHDHRRYSEIKQIVARAGYSAGVEATCLRIFRQIAEAEALIHGCEVEDVHFHEVGAVDSIVDIVGAAICLDYLAVEHVVCSNVELGSGFVKCAHGTLPVPVPATVEILKGVDCQYGGVDGEATTPTGAAILKGTVDSFGSVVGFRAERIGYGVGTRDFRVPNVLRVMIGELVGDAAPPHSGTIECLEIKANIDDMTPEAFEPLMERLFERGASDVFLTPIVMKKNRLAQMVSVLCPVGRKDILVDTLFAHSTTIGVRIHTATKRVLPRTELSFETSFGTVRVKLVDLPDARSRWKVEHDDVKAMSAASGIPYGAIRKDIEAEVRAQLDSGARAGVAGA